MPFTCPATLLRRLMRAAFSCCSIVLLIPPPRWGGYRIIIPPFAYRSIPDHGFDGSEMQVPMPLTDTLPSNSWIVHSSTLYMNTALFADPNWEMRCNSPV